MGIVLGAHFIAIPEGKSEDDWLPELVDSSDRLHHAARLYKARKLERLLISVSSRTADSTFIEKHKSLTVSLLEEWGVPKTAIDFDVVSRNTHENTLEAVSYLSKYPLSESVILITSAYHMPRAAESFARQGVTIIPAPTDYQNKQSTKWMPTTRSLHLSQVAIHEFVGLWWYRLKYW